MQNSNTLHVRMDNELRENAQEIISKLGLTEADVVKMLYNQIVLQGGIPFELKLPDRVSFERRLKTELDKGLQSIENKDTYTLEEIKKVMGI